MHFARVNCSLTKDCLLVSTRLSQILMPLVEFCIHYLIAGMLIECCRQRILNGSIKRKESYSNYEGWSK